ncbi:kinase-like domain, phloem protein 2-like protein, partial [Tanacetum coccineum]
VKHEKLGKLKNDQQVLKSNISMNQVQQWPIKFLEFFKIDKNYDELFWLDKVNGKKLLMVSAKALHESANANNFTLIPSSQSSPLNIHDITRIPKRREDGWMEIQVWKFNSTLEFKDDSLSILMNFESLDGNMSGLIVCGLEFWPV